MKKLYIYILFCFLIFFSCTNLNVKRPKLIISLVVDQMRPDLLTKYDDLYNGGFRWLIDHGKWFTNTHHEHGYTATGPGHFSIGSGQYPAKLAVLGNSFYDRDLKKIVNEHVVDVLDHSQFDKDIPWFEGKQPSTEVLVVFIWEEIVKHLEGCTLHRIRIEETPTIYTDYYGPIDE